MPYTTIPPVSTGDLITSTIFNNLINNADQAHKPTYAQLLYVPPSNVNVSSTASFVDADATNMKVVLTPTTTRVRFLIVGRFTGNTGYVDISNGASRMGDSSVGLGGFSGASTYAFGGVFSGLTANTTYTFTLQMRTSSATVAQVLSGFPLIILATEA